MKHSRSTEGFSLARPTYRDRDGKTQRSPRWHARFKDHAGIWRRLLAYTDKSASTAFGRRLRDLAELRAAGERPSRDLARWVNDLSESTLQKLAEWGVVERSSLAALHGLEEHLDDWRDSIIDGGRTQKHATLLHARALKVVRGCGFRRYSDVNAGDVERFVAKLRVSGSSIRTANFHLKAVQQFCRWMVAQDRAHGLPLATAKPATVTDEKQRRALTGADLGRLIQAAEKAPAFRRTTGPERALLYRTAALTGLRANELRTLTAGAFDLDSDLSPTVTVQARYAKNRKIATLPLRSDLAALLRVHLVGKHPSARAFYVPRLTAKMIRNDARAAGVPIDTADGTLDFHSLRVSFVTSLARSGVHPKVAQTLARHSTMELTMRVYTKFGDEEERAGVEALPPLPAVAGA